MKPLPNTLPPLVTDRLLLRAMRESDIEELFAIYGDPEVMRYASDDAFSDPRIVLDMLASVDQLLAKGTSLEWGIEERSGEFIGTCGLHSFEPTNSSSMVGCLLARKAWGKGYMHEALIAMFRYAKLDLGLICLRADIDAHNTRAIRLFRTFGFQHVHATFYECVL